MTLCDCERCFERGAPIERGTCHCGCGGKTNRAPYTDPKRGYVKGEPLAFLRGHGCRKRDWRDRYSEDGPNPEGVCQYPGCDERTPLAGYTARHAGIVKGTPMRYCRAHFQPGRKRAVLTYAVEDRDYATPCHVFSGDARKGEYGSVGDRLAHVVAWEAENGPLAPGLLLHHDCEVKLCVNVAHLQPKTRAEHARIHMELRIPAETRAAIRDELRAATPVVRIAARYNVSRSFIHRVKNAMRIDGDI